jgi:hypothetical protein
MRAEIFRRRVRTAELVAAQPAAAANQRTVPA